MGIKNYNVSLEEEIVIIARKNLEVGQSLSPILNQLLKDWIIKKQKQKQNED